MLNYSSVILIEAKPETAAVA